MRIYGNRLWPTIQTRHRIIQNDFEIFHCFVFSLVPVLAVGFDQLNQRIELQNERMRLYKQKLQVIMPFNFYDFYLPISLLGVRNSFE